MAKMLYVGNLPWSTTEKDLVDFLGAQGGIMSARIIADRESGRSKGFGFVEVKEEDADRIVQSMNGKNLGGREIIINEARPRTQ